MKLNRSLKLKILREKLKYEIFIRIMLKETDDGVKVKGLLSGKFEVREGLRQDNPLSSLFSFTLKKK